MIALMVWACLTASPTECKVMMIAQGFSDTNQCFVFKDIMLAGWLTQHTNIKLREGTGPICTNNPQWLMYRFGA